MSDNEKVGQIKMLPANTIIYSIGNQTTFKLFKSEVILITNTCFGSSMIFCKPQIAYGYLLTGEDEKWVDKGNDEWHVDYNDTIENTKELRKGMFPYLEVEFKKE